MFFAFIFIMSHFFLIPTLKEFKKSIKICQSYSKNKSGPVFSDSQCSFQLLRLVGCGVKWPRQQMRSGVLNFHPNLSV